MVEYFFSFMSVLWVIFIPCLRFLLMRPALVFLFFLLISKWNVRALADVDPSLVARRKPIERPLVLVAKMGPENFIIPTEFATASFFQFSGRPGFEKLRVQRVQLVYTKFKLNKDFSQEKLNEERLVWLKRLWPELFAMPDVNWQLVMQTGPLNQEDAKLAFHGFIITFEKESMKEMRKQEIQALESLWTNPALWKDTMKVEKYSRTVSHQEFTGKYLPKSTKKRKAGVEYDSEGLFGRSKKMVTVRDTVWKEKKVNLKVPRVGLREFYKYIPDSMVLSAIHENPQWANGPVVIDVTGSMSSYIAQILLWWRFQIPAAESHHFTVFNDGNRTPDHQKVAGKVKGVYQVEAKSFEALRNMVSTAMSNGDGGDSQENNIEALLASQKSNPSASCFLMIADNAAPVRDMAFLSGVKKKVFVVACGNQDFLNPQLVEIAWKTAGGVYFRGQTLIDFSAFANDKEVQFGPERFRIVRGKVIFADKYKSTRGPFR
jgi:hypothetical protein